MEVEQKQNVINCVYQVYTEKIMKSFYSIVRFYSNSLSKENIAIGLIMISGGRLFFKFSDDKIEFVSKLNPSISKLLNFSLSQIKNSLIEPTLNYKKIIVDDELFNLSYLERLSNYNNGIIQFDKPILINQVYDELKFNSFFEKYISIKNEKIVLPKEVNSVFHNRIKTSLYEPLKDTIDVDKTIKKREIPSLYFNYHLDGLGVNGAIYTIKAIDLNSNKHLNQNKMKQTAVEWLVEQLKTMDTKSFNRLIQIEMSRENFEECFEQAKAMEKEQIMDAFESAEKDCGRDFLHGDLYYNETFKSE